MNDASCSCPQANSTDDFTRDKRTRNTKAYLTLQRAVNQTSKDLSLNFYLGLLMSKLIEVIIAKCLSTPTDFRQKCGRLRLILVISNLLDLINEPSVSTRRSPPLRSLNVP